MTNWTNLSPGRGQRLERALNDSNAGSILLQTFITRKVADLTNRALGVWTALDHRDGSGDAAYINRRTAGTTGGSWLADTGTVVEETGSYAQVSFPYRTAVTRMQVTRFLQRTGASYTNVLEQEMRLKAGNDFPNLLENAGVQGNTAVNAQQPNGLLTLINAVPTQSLLQDDGAGAFSVAGEDLTRAKLDELVDAVRGPSSDKMIFGSRLGLRKVNALLAANQRWVGETEIAAGFRVKTYDNIPLIESTQIPDALVNTTANQGAFNISDYTGGSTTALVCVNREDVYWEDLTPVTVEPLAKTTSQNDAADIYADTTLVFSNTLAGAILAGITIA